MNEKFNHKSVKIIDWFLRTIGINVHQKHIPLYKFYQFIALFPAICSGLAIALYIFEKRKQPSEAFIAAAYIGGTITWKLTVIVFLRNRNKILNLLQMIDADVYEYPDKKETALDFHEILDERNSFKVLTMILGYVCFGFSLIVVSPMVGFLITGVYQTRMHPAAYPWTEEGTVSFVVVSISQLTGCISVFWIFYVIQVLVTLLTIEFLKQYEKLGTALLTLKRRTEETVLNSMMRNSSGDFTDREYGRYEESFRSQCDNVYGQNLRHCIKHHQQLWR